MTEVAACNRDDVLITDELATRPRRAPDYEGENRALTDLAETLAVAPHDVLQRLVETAMALTRADSAGISLLEPGGANGLFRWVAMAGAWAPYRGGTMPREESPCGEVIARETVLLAKQPERAFPALLQGEPSIGEGLLAPFLIDGTPAGTVWVIKHDPEGRFDAEDARLLQSLGRFASAGQQMVAALDDARASRAESEARLSQSELRVTTELSRSRALQRLSTRLIPEQSPEALYDQILDTALELMRADAVSIQLLDDDGKRLRRVATRNLHPDSTEYWTWVDASHASTCGQALAKNERVVLEDVEATPELVGTGDLEAFRASGTRAVQSSPLLTRTGRPIGMISTHWRQPRQFNESDFGLFDVLARQVADLIERSRTETVLRESEEKYRLLFDSIDEGFCIIELLFGADGDPSDYRFVEVNPAFERQTGLIDAAGKRMRALRPEHEAHWFEIYGRIALTGKAERFESEAAALGRWYDVYAFRIGLPAERRVAILFNDITQRRATDAAMRESEERFREFGENSSDALWIVDVETMQLVYLSPAFERIWGESRDRVVNDLGRWAELIHPDDRELAAQAMPRSFAGHPHVIDYRIVRPDGEVRWIRDTGFPMREGGVVKRIGGIAQDVTDLKNAERRQNLLLAELQHRVRNTLGVIRSIARRSAQTSDTVEQLGAHLDGRIEAFARVQAIVTRRPDRGVDLAGLIEDEMVAHAMREREQYKLAGPEVMLAAKPAETVSLAIHELATNAVKYGAFAHDGGRLDIRWRVADGRLLFDWIESGGDFAGGEPERQGFGHELLRRVLPYDLQAATEIEFAPGGLHFRLDMPLEGNIA